MNKITLPELALWQHAEFPFTLIDVRRDIKRAAEGDEIAGGQWLDPAHWLAWKDSVPKDKPAVLYCAYGHEISQGLVAALRALEVATTRHLGNTATLSALGDQATSVTLSGGSLSARWNQRCSNGPPSGRKTASKVKVPAPASG